MDSILLNADVGEDCGDDSEIIPLVDIANIACGAHAGDLRSMHDAVSLCHQHGVRIGAHPGYPDKSNFGRVSRSYPADDFMQTINEQLAALDMIAKNNNCQLSYIKPHGALYHDLTADKTLAHLFLNACEVFISQKTKIDNANELSLIGPPGSLLSNLAPSYSLKFIAEAFIDRRYDDDNRLLPRSKDNAIIHDIDQACEQALTIAKTSTVVSCSGRTLKLEADTLCLHGDSPNAIKLAQRVSDLLSPFRPPRQ